MLASPERGGAEWAYVAASRQRCDLQVFVSHHDLRSVEDALARAWSRSQEKSLALDRVDPAQRAAAIERARGDFSRAPPERLLARAGELAAEREQLRAQAHDASAAERERVAAVRAELARAHDGLAEATERHERLSDALARTPVWRRAERGRLRDNVRRASRDVERHRGAGRAAEAELKRLGRTVARVDAAERAWGRTYELGRELDAVHERHGVSRDGLGRERSESGRDRDRESRERGTGRGW